MKSLLYLIPAVIILILIVPIFVELRFSYNPLYNRGVVALFLFKIKIFYFVLSFHEGYLQLENENQTKAQKLEFESQQFAVMEEFGRQIKDKVRLKKMYVFYNIGLGDAFLSALVCGVINLALTQTFLVLKNQKPTASFCVFDTVSYNKKTCEIAFRTSLSISFFDVAYSYIYSVIITKKQA